MIYLLGVLSLPIVGALIAIAGLAVAIDRVPRLARSVGRLKADFLQGADGKLEAKPNPQQREEL